MIMEILNSDNLIKAMANMDRELVLKRYAAVYRETRTLLGVGAFSMDAAVQGAVANMHKRTENDAQLLADEVEYEMELLAREYMKVYGEEYKVYTDRYQAYNWSPMKFEDWLRGKKGHEALTVSPKYL
jgi:hypothetical protein